MVGGGLAGVACALELGDNGIEVTLFDRNDYNQFQPLLYQVASSQLPAEDIARPHRTIFKDHTTVRVLTADMVAVHTEPRAHFAAWLGVHAMLLSGVHSKVDAFLSWAWDYFDRDHAATIEAMSTRERLA